MAKVSFRMSEENTSGCQGKSRKQLREVEDAQLAAHRLVESTRIVVKNEFSSGNLGFPRANFQSITLLLCSKQKFKFWANPVKDPAFFQKI